MQNGFIVDIFSTIEDISDYDMVFIFNLQKPFEALLYAKLSIYYKKPYIFFPVFWDLDSLRMKDVISLRTIIKAFFSNNNLFFIKRILDYCHNRKYYQKFNIPFMQFKNIKKIGDFIFENAKFVIPNSIAEKKHLIQKFGDKHSYKMHVIYNGTNINSFETDDKKFIDKYQLPDYFICCIGGIGPRKNQLNLVKAANLVNVDLVIAGKSSKNNRQYERKVNKIAQKNIHFLGEIPENDVKWILQKSNGHIQPSYIETPGLSSLEAIILGKPIAVSDVPPVREYFQSNAIYCNPYNVESIRETLIELKKNSTKAKLDPRILEWNTVLIDLLYLLN